MRYKTAGAFRQALEARLREQSLKDKVPLSRQRKMIAFDRFLARLVNKDAEGWAIKGGLALQYRFRHLARTTKDIDAITRGQLHREELTARLRRTGSLELRDWFEFEIGEPTPAATGAPQGGLRFPIRCLLAGRNFETFHLDVGQGDPIVGKPEQLSAPPLLKFAGILPSRVRCCPLATQIAEKVHAYTRPYAGGGSSRVRDLVDILVIASLRRVSTSALSRALKATFQARSTHELPGEFPKPPTSWSGAYKKLARELDLRWSTVEEAGEAAGQFLNPVRRNKLARRWNPDKWAWT